MNMSQQPLLHYFNILASKDYDFDMMSSSGVGKLAHLTCGKSGEIIQEYEKLFGRPGDNNPGWSWVESLSEDAPLMKASELIALGVNLHLHHAAAFFRRVLRPKMRWRVFDIELDLPGSLPVALSPWPRTREQTSIVITCASIRVTQDFGCLIQ